MNQKLGLLKLTVILGVGVSFCERNALGVVLGAVVANGDGTITYTYLVDNSAGTFDIAGWSLEIPRRNADWNPSDQFSGGDVTVPNAGWFASTGIPGADGWFAQDFLSIDPASDILVGDGLGGFSLTSSLLPELVPYYEFSADGLSTSGMTMGPARMPVGMAEGGGPYSALAMGALAMMTIRWRSGQRRRQ